MVDRGSIFIDAFIFVLKDIHIDRWDWWMGAAWNGGIVFCSGNPFARCPRQKIGIVKRKEAFRSRIQTGGGRKLEADG